MLKIAINRKIVNKMGPKDGPKLTDNWENVELTGEELKDLILKGTAFCNSQLRVGTKKLENFMLSNSIWLDFDNKDTEHQLTVEKALRHPWIVDSAFALYTSPSHTADHNRFRLVFLLPDTIIDPNIYKSYIEAFIHRTHSDPAPSAITQAFFGNTNADVYIFGKTLDPKDIEQTLTKHKSFVMWNKRKFNGEVDADLIRDALAHIPKKMNYLDWSKVCHAVNYACKFDVDTAKALIDEWSPGRGNEIYNKLKSPMKEISSGTLFWYAEQNGWEPPQGFGRSKKGDVLVDTEGKARGVKEPLNPEIVKAWLQSNYEFRLNDVTKRHEILVPDGKFVPLTDRDVNEIWVILHESGIKTPITTVRAVIESNLSPKFNPIKNYFNNLPAWDGENHIKAFADRIPVPEEFLMKFYDYFARWLVGAYRCAVLYQPNHLCLVLQSNQQGVGKTSIFRHLTPPELLDYYAEVQNFRPEDKDNKLHLAEKFLINLDELETSTRDEIGHLKSLMTQNIFPMRVPYGRYSENRQRIASFCGSINKQQFLTDTTGNRRFLIVKVTGEIDFTSDYDHQQLWAQVKQLHVDGFRSWYNLEEIQEIEQENEQYRLLSAEEDILPQYLDVSLQSDGYNVKQWTSTQICDHLNAKTSQRLSTIRMGWALKKLGYQQIQRRNENGKPKYYWLVKERVEPEPF